MMKIARGKRVPGGAVDRSTRVERRTTASAPNSANASFASHTAPGRRRHNARPAATPTLVITRRAPRKTKDNVDRELKCARLVAACKARLAGFHTVNSRIKMRSQPPAGILRIGSADRARKSEDGDEVEEDAARQTAGSPRGIAEGNGSGCVFA